MLFVVDFPTTPFNSSLQGCFPNSFVAEVGIFFSILLFQWYIFYYFFRRHCDVALFTHHLDSWGSCSFLAYPFNRSVVFSFEFSNLIKFSLLPQLESCLKSFLPIVPFFYSSGGSVLLISSSNIPSSQVHVLFLPCSTGVLPEFFPSHLVLTGVVSNSILSIKLLIRVFATVKFS